MNEYFVTYNAYAQNPETVDRMGDYFTPDVKFVPYVSAFGGAQNAVTNRDDFFRMFTGHPTVYEQFEVENVAVDESDCRRLPQGSPFRFKSERSTCEEALPAAVPVGAG